MSVVSEKKPTFSEKQKLKAFREQFLGMTEAGLSCKILNEKDIRILYDPETHKIHAYSNVPIKIDNQFLGYEVLWELKEFTLDLKEKRSLEPDNIDMVVIRGSASFKEKKRNMYTSMRRQEAYRVSKNRFFNLLINGGIEKSDMLALYLPVGSNVKRTCIISEWFDIEDLEGLKIVNVNPKKRDRNNAAALIVATANKKREESYSANRSLDEKFKNIDAARAQGQSVLAIFADSFNVDIYGNTDLSTKLTISGEMGFNRIGNMLPYDYEPPQSNDYFEK